MIKIGKKKVKTLISEKLINKEVLSHALINKEIFMHLTVYSVSLKDVYAFCNKITVPFSVALKCNKLS